MNLVVVGLSHKTAPLEVRERLSVAAEALPSLLAGLERVDGVHESLLLATCNRTEIYGDVTEPVRDSARLAEFLAQLGKVTQADLAPHVYQRHGVDAVRQIFRVAASLDSLVVGEAQILGQVKSAVAAAQAAAILRGSLGRVMDRAFSVAKRVRTETSVGEAKLSVSSVAVDLARTIFGDLTGRSVMLIGAGKMGRLTLEHLRSAGVATIFVANRSAERRRRMLEGFDDIRTVEIELDDVNESLAEVDIAVSSVQAGRYIVDRPGVQRVMRRRRGQPLFLVDIAVPRSLDPAVHEVENVFRYDIDDLQSVVETNMASRRQEAERAERLVEAEAETFFRSLRVLEVGPTIRELLDHLEDVRTREIEKHARQLGALSPEARDAVDAMTRAMIKKVAHGAIVELRRAGASADGKEVIDVLQRALIRPAGAREGER